jgi:hypothetical protein
MWRTVAAVTDGGDAIMFSRTRDGGALCLTIMAGEERIKQYAGDGEEIQKLLSLVLESARDG